ncbi:aldehyde dehydrogenase [archaeon RBG_16_50_20]|nr:MAG: aldehyde dehydrogenase [archaeon RBG_16_50_20]
MRTVNPYTEKTLQEYHEESLDEVRAKITGLRKAQQEWKLDLDARMQALKEVRTRFASASNELGILMSTEMGKPVSQSEAELKKCLWTIDYVIENAAKFLAPEEVKTDAKKSYIRFDPLGVILLIMPWNFPAWQFIRAAVPALAAGNAVLLKHASLVSGTSVKLSEIFSLDTFKSSVTRGENAKEAIKYSDGVSLTGSTSVGAMVAEEAGRQLKKVVLELGGSDPYIVLDRSNLDQAVKNCAFARMQNNGQSCIASKRFIVHEDVFNEFYAGMKDEFSKVAIGDPLDKSTFLGPLSSRDQKETVADQIKRMKTLGTVEELAGGLGGNFIPPTIARIESNFDEEVFGPVAILKKFKTPEEAIKLANETPFGLGASIWGDPASAEKLVPHIEAGLVFINKIVTSDPRLPFGGVKKSGLGVELSRYGLLEFTSKRTIWVN